MRIHLTLILLLLLCLPGAVRAEEPAAPDGCKPEFRALYDNAVVEIKGVGTRDVVVVTDPLCWHCRLAHKLLGEYPELYRTVRVSFFSRRSFIGSDMAAWLLEDQAGGDALKALLDFAYRDLKQPKTQDLAEARMIVLIQFTDAFPWLLKDTTLPELYTRLQHDHEAHVQKSADLAKAVHFPGTPVLIADSVILVGYAPDPWLKALKEAPVCK